jgi:hypothetical protein
MVDRKWRKGLAKIVNIQKSQRHEIPARTTYPDTTGPMPGPANGATVKIARAVPRSFASQMSDMRALKDSPCQNGTFSLKQTIPTLNLLMGQLQMYPQGNGKSKWM